MPPTANGWSTAIPANPGTPGIKLWVASKIISESAAIATTAFSWTGAAINDISINGLNGVQSANPVVYKWATSIPTITGTSVYTWALNTFSATPSGWSTSTSGGTEGQTLWAARVQLVDSAANATTNIDWSTANIGAVGYKGVSGGQGVQGNSAKRAYALTSASSLGSGSVVTTGSTSLPPTNSTFGNGLTWTASPSTPATGQSLYQSDGIYNPVTNQITWETPYISALKVGSLSALSTNTGALTVTGGISLPTGGAIYSGIYTSSWAWPVIAGSGFLIHPNGILIGDHVNGAYVQITAAGNFYSPQFTIVGGNATFSGALSAATGTFLGTLKVGTNPLVSGASMTGTGAVFNPSGTFAIGNATKNISFNGTTFTLNGEVVATGNIPLGAISSNVFGDIGGILAYPPNSSSTYTTAAIALGALTATGGNIRAVFSTSVRCHVENPAVDAIQLSMHFYKNGVEVGTRLQSLARTAFFNDALGNGYAVAVPFTFETLTDTVTGTQTFTCKVKMQCFRSDGVQVTPYNGGITTSYIFTEGNIGLQEIKR